MGVDEEKQTQTFPPGGKRKKEAGENILVLKVVMF